MKQVKITFFCDYKDCFKEISASCFTKKYLNTLDGLERLAENAGWIHKDGKIYCPKHAKT